MPTDEEYVTCLVCSAQMTMINNRHLARHSISIGQYIEAFPGAPLRSAKVVAKQKANAARINSSRKGCPRTASDIAAIKMGRSKSARKPVRQPMSDAQKQKLSEIAKASYASGARRPVNLGKPKPADVRQKIGAALQGRIVGPTSARKAIATKKEKGVRLGLPEGYRHSAETRKKFSDAPMNRFLADQAKQRRAHSSTQHGDIHPDMLAFVTSLVPTEKITMQDRLALLPLELGMYLPNRRIAIDYCDLETHSKNHRRDHELKQAMCAQAGLRLITIFEDEWKFKHEIVRGMLANALKIAQQRIHARSCEIRHVDPRDANAFLAKNHVMGRGRSNVRIGLFKHEQLVSLMTFSKSDTTHRNPAGWEINRFCNLIGRNIPGAASKLFAAFVAHSKPDRVTTYADLRWGAGGVYAHLGFKHVRDTVPGYWFFKLDDLVRIHRYSLRVTAEEKARGLTGTEARLAQGYHRIFDCGHAKWIWTLDA